MHAQFVDVSGVDIGGVQYIGAVNIFLRDKGYSLSFSCIPSPNEQKRIWPTDEVINDEMTMKVMM